MPAVAPVIAAPAASAASAHRAGYAVLALSLLCNGAAAHLTRESTRHLGVLWVVAVLCLAGPVGASAVGWCLRRLGAEVALARVTPSAQLREFRRRPRALALAAAAGAAASALMVAVVARHGAETAAFLANLTMVFVVIGGLWRGERLGWSDVAAIALVLLGAVLFSLGRDLALATWALPLMALSCLGSAVKQTCVRVATTREDVPAFTGAKQLAMGLLAVAAALASGEPVPTGEGLAWATAAGVLQSGIGIPLLYLGYEAVGLARGAPVDALRPVAVLVIGLALGAALPGPLRLIGAALILLGAALLAARGPRSSPVIATPRP
jgi:drug/metabolite transporter (DMT)-like permease